MKRAASTVTIAILLALGLPAITAQANPGLTVTPLNGDTLTAADLVDALVGTGISTSNEAYAYVSQATGTFSGGTGIIGFESGVLLTSGAVANVVGPNESDSHHCGSTRLPVTPTWTCSRARRRRTRRSCRSRSSRPNHGHIPYVFASDEYNEFVLQGFNDVFGFFVNGTNCAKVPDTDVPVSIDTINGGIRSGARTHPIRTCIGTTRSPTVAAPIDTEMDGLTVVLTCTASVTPGEANTAKLAIADVGDSQLDSAVFLEAGSFSSGRRRTR